VNWQDIREGMEVFDPAGRDIGHVEIIRNGYFFLTCDTLIPVVRERIVVDARTSVASVDAGGVRLLHDRMALLLLNARPRDSKSSHQVAPGEDISAMHRGDEDQDREGHAHHGPMQS
jgi:hypothetical protein